MKVLHIPNYYYPHIGGIEQVTRDTVNSLMGKCEQKVICFSDSKNTVYTQVDGIDITHVKCQAKVASQSIALTYGKELKKIMKSYNPDVVIFHYPNPFVAHFLKKYLKKKTFKFILYWHLDITKQKILGKFFNLQTKKLLDKADKVIATTPNYIEGSPWLTKYKDKCEVIYNCVSNAMVTYDEHHVSLANEIKEKYKDKTIIFAFGRHVEYKGLEYLIKASKLLDDSYKVLIGGKGPLTDSLKELAKDDNKIEFLGRIEDDKLKSYILSCDIFAFPSITKNEAFGVGLAEAMCYAKPQVTFTIPGSGVNFVSLNGKTCIEVENRNVEEYAKAIKKLANDKELRDTLGKASKERANELFSFNRFKESINSLINSL